MQAVELVARGLTTKEAAPLMCLSERMVKSYLESARRKVDASNTTNLVAIVLSAQRDV
jgi:DNA-binding CsgD family transcriptional regulator